MKESPIPQAVFHLLLGQAAVTFPGSCAARPSPSVWISYRSNCAADPAFPSPVVLNGKQYCDAVIPVLCDPALQPGNPINAVTLCQGPNRSVYVERIAEALCRSFKAAGY